MRTDLLKCVMIALAIAGCASDAECPEGYELNGYCQKIMPMPADGGGDGDGDACELEPEFEGGFASPCMDAVNHSECPCEADYCAVMPGADEGYCTATDCVDHPENCPEGWGCFDLAFTGMDLSVCTKPPAQ